MYRPLCLDTATEQKNHHNKTERYLENETFLRATFNTMNVRKAPRKTETILDILIEINTAEARTETLESIDIAPDSSPEDGFSDSEHSLHAYVKNRF